LANSAEILDQCLASGILAIDGHSRITAFRLCLEVCRLIPPASPIHRGPSASIRTVLQRSLSTAPVLERNCPECPAATGCFASHHSGT
jgi:hypothetical protein